MSTSNQNETDKPNQNPNPLPPVNGNILLESDTELKEVTHITGMYEDWFLDYASYVILERAVPAILDGLKPVQRRILHAMKEMDDGRFHKVANVIGQAMQYHPHGDAAIGDALVNLGQKDLLIDTQGNWGDTRTGDSAAAPRYIEARLSKFALEVAFNPQTTNWQLSYDGRKREPVTLPVKFPLLLAQGVEGIAVGLSTRILPHNFIELVNGCIHILEGKEPVIFPDFPTGGLIDVTNYQGGHRGGKVKIRARIEEKDKKTLVIREIPYGKTTTSVIESILKANDSGKIKIKRVVDNTAKDVEIVIELAPNVSPDITIDALYAFTECESTESPNACVIIEDRPHFLNVIDILKISTESTIGLLKRELEIKLDELEAKWHFSSLEKIFIENRIYRDIEECETWESVLETIDRGLEPHKSILKREVTRDDIARLTEIKIKRISKFDSFKADEEINTLESGIEDTQYHLNHLTPYAINYYRELLKKYSKGKERKTEIRVFDDISVNQVAIANQKLYINREEGFIGFGLKKDEYICDCSDLDDIIVFMADGKMVVTRIQEKQFVGKNIIHADVWRKNDERRIYNLIYMDGKTKITYGKRFNVTAITRDRDYDLTKGSPGSKVVYFTANPNGESEVVTIHLSSGARARIKTFDFDFGELLIKGRQSQGNIVTRYPVRTIKQKSVGPSSIGAQKVWYDPVVGRLNKDERGTYIGEFNTNDLVLVIYKDGSYELTSHELSNRYEPSDVLFLQRFDPSLIISAIYVDGNTKHYNVKRFQIETQTLDKRFLFITEHRASKLIMATTHPEPEIKVVLLKGRQGEKVEEQLWLNKFMEVKGWKAIGNRLASHPVQSVQLVSSVMVIPELSQKPKLEPEANGEADEETREQIGLF